MDTFKKPVAYFVNVLNPVIKSINKRKSLKRTTGILVGIPLLLACGIYFVMQSGSTVTANVDDYIYELPYQSGMRYKVVQGYGGLFSHKNIAAIDFEMPEGTPVYAAREGILFSYKDNSDEGGMFSKYKNKANFIIIKHADGSFGCYWHLKKNGVRVKKGFVAKGQLIGLSGATGQVIRPHLHFSVKKKLNYQMNSFVQTKFNTTEGIVIVKKGKSYCRP